MFHMFKKVKKSIGMLRRERYNRNHSGLGWVAKLGRALF